MTTLRARWLGRVSYAEAADLQRALHECTADDYLLTLEHPPVYTLGTRADPAHVLVPPAQVGATLVRTDRGGDVTYHGPGQLVGYPIVTLPEWQEGRADVVAYVRALERVLVAVLADFGIAGTTEAGFTGVWVGTEKVAAIGVKVAGRRTRHGVALNVDPDLAMFEHIVPCGIPDRGVTSLARLLGAAPPMADVVDRFVARFAETFGHHTVDTQSVAPVASPAPSDHVTVNPALRGSSSPARAGGADDGVRAEPVRLLGRLAAAGVEVSEADASFRRPEWMKVRADLGPDYRATKRLMRGLSLTTVCEEAGCPNIYECWADRTATFMILGERCTRACGFCLVDTRHPLAPEADEPARVADAVVTLGLAHAVVTSVARDDLPDGGAAHFAATIAAIRERSPQTTVEVLIPDCKGDAAALDVILHARPDVLNHNLETVARLQRAVRPNAGYARSLTVLARARAAGLVAKSGLIAGMGETDDEMRAAITDLRNVGVEVLTVGQYLRPSPAHTPVVRWWTPDEFDALRAFAERLGFAHVECGPLVRSSYHAKRAVETATPVTLSARERLMGRVLDGISDELRAFLEAQPVFFVATAPDDPDGHVNCSPKGLDTFRVIDDHTVAYLDLTGSGVETVAHLRDNGRITLMFCAFTGRPDIVRLYGRGHAVPVDAPDAAPLLARFPEIPGARSVIVVDVERVSSSRGFAVPRMTLDAPRDELVTWAEKKGPDAIARYWRDKNATSIDGLPGIG